MELKPIHPPECSEVPKDKDTDIGTVTTTEANGNTESSGDKLNDDASESGDSSDEELLVELASKKFPFLNRGKVVLPTAGTGDKNKKNADSLKKARDAQLKAELDKLAAEQKTKNK